MHDLKRTTLGVEIKRSLLKWIYNSSQLFSKKTQIVLLLIEFLHLCRVPSGRLPYLIGLVWSLIKVFHAACSCLLRLSVFGTRFLLSAYYFFSCGCNRSILRICETWECVLHHGCFHTWVAWRRSQTRGYFLRGSVCLCICKRTLMWNNITFSWWSRLDSGPWSGSFRERTQPIRQSGQNSLDMCCLAKMACQYRQYGLAPFCIAVAIQYCFATRHCCKELLFSSL